MRIAQDEEDLVGKVCVCSVGRVGIVTGKSTIILENPAPAINTILEGWAGLGLDGKGNWFSTNPCVVAESGHEFYMKLRNRFGGKMAFND